MIIRKLYLLLLLLYLFLRLLGRLYYLFLLNTITILVFIQIISHSSNITRSYDRFEIDVIFSRIC